MRATTRVAAKGSGGIEDNKMYALFAGPQLI